MSRALTAATDLLTKANSKVNELETAVDRYALSSFKVLQAADEQSFTLARECVLLLDHLDIMIRRAGERGEPINSLSDARRRLCSLLEAAQIEEILVNAGMFSTIPYTLRRAPLGRVARKESLWKCREEVTR